MKINFNELNGWQRMWVLSAVLWLIVVTIFSITSIPSKFELAPISPYASQTEKTVRHLSAEIVDLTDKEVSKLIPTLTTEEKKLLADVIAETKKIRNEHLRDVFVHICISLLFWTIPSILIYLFGFSVAWVLQGFKKK